MSAISEIGKEMLNIKGAVAFWTDKKEEEVSVTDGAKVFGVAAAAGPAAIFAVLNAPAIIVVGGLIAIVAGLSGCNRSVSWNNKGLALDKQGKLDEAINAYDKALEINPKFALAWNNKGSNRSAPSCGGELGSGFGDG